MSHHRTPLAGLAGLLVLVSTSAVCPVSAQKKPATPTAKSKGAVELPEPVFLPLAAGPQAVTATCVGGSGRYVAFLVVPAAGAAGPGHVAVVDLKTAQLVGTIPAQDAKSLVAADARRLFIADPARRTLARYDLATLAPEKSGPLPTSMTLHGLAAAPAGTGPLLATARQNDYRQEAFLVSPDTLQRIEGTTNPRPPYHLAPATRIRGLGDTRRFVLANPGDNTTIGGGSAVIDPARRKWVVSEHDSAHVQGTMDGRIVEVKGVSYINGVKVQQTFFVPAVNGPFHLAFKPGECALHACGDENPLFTLAVKSPEPGSHPEDRWFLHEEYKTLAVLDRGETGLSFYPLDIRAEALQRMTPISEPRVVERALPPAVRGADYRAQLECWPPEAAATLKLTKAPPGMAVSREGVLTWKVPADFAKATSDVTLSVTSGTTDYPRPLRIVLDGLTAADEAAARKLPPDTQVPSEEIVLNGAVKSICSAGAGRYLLLSLPKERQVAVFDAKARKVVKSWAMAESDFRVAGGRTHAYVLLLESRVLQRFDLATLEREWTKASPVDGLVEAIAMGAASDGPLAFCRPFDRDKMYLEDNLHFIDPATLKPLDFPELTDPGSGQKYRQRIPVCWSPSLRAAANGRLFTWFQPSGGSDTFFVEEIQGVQLQGRELRAFGHAILPSPDGRHYYGAGYTLDEKHRPVLSSNFITDARLFLPADSGPLFIEVTPLQLANQRAFPAFRRVAEEPTAKPTNVTVRLAGVEMPLGVIGNVLRIHDDPKDMYTPRGPMARDMSVHLMPDHGVLVSLAGRFDRLEIHPFNLDSMLEQSGEDYLLFASEPPGDAVRGTKFTYTPVVKAKAGGAMVKLQSGPDGMAITGGTLAWTVPADLAAKEAAVVLSVADAKGKEQFQSFRIRLTGGTIVESEPKPEVKPKRANPR